MKQGLLSSLIIVALSASCGVFAAETHTHEMQHNRNARQAVHLHEGLVKKIDQKKATVTLQHGDLAEVGMPAMTMGYPVRHAQDLAALHAGDKVRFTLEKRGADYIVIHIEAVKL